MKQGDQQSESYGIGFQAGVERVVAEDFPLTKASQTKLSRAERYKQLASLLQEWQAEPGAYDEQTWPNLESALKDSVLNCSETEESNS